MSVRGLESRAMAWPVEMQREERSTVLGAFFTLFGMTAAHSVTETARDALFLAQVPVKRLVWVYLAIAAITVVVGRVRDRRGKVEHAARLRPGLLVGAGVTLAFWGAARARTPWVPYALYLWPGLYGTWIVATLWGVIGAVFTLSQAKRLFGFIGAGGVLGALTGSGLARVLTGAFSPDHLLPLGAALFLASGLGPARVLDRSLEVAPSSAAPDATAVAATPSTFRGALDALTGDPYAKRILTLVLLATMAFTTTDFLFKSSVAAHVRTADLGTFLATVSLVLNALALVMQLVLVRFVLRVLGVHRALSVLPLLMTIGAVGVVAAPSLAAAVVVRAVDGTFRHSLHKTTGEILFVPLSRAARARVQPMIDLMGQRGGQVIASVALLPVFALGGERALGAAIAVLASAWLALALSFRQPYLDVFRRALREGRIEDSGELPALDLGTLEVLFAALNSEKDTEVLGALDLLAVQERGRLIPALILFHPSKLVVLRALSLFGAEKRRDFVPIADRLLIEHADAEVRAAALRARWQVMPDEAFMRSCIDAKEGFAEVRATALVALVARGSLSGEEVRREVAALASSAPGVRLALAQAIVLEPVREFEQALLSLATDVDVEVRTAAVTAMGHVASEAFLPVLMDRLGARHEAAAARQALSEIGAPAFDALDRAIGDRGLRMDLRGGAARTLGQLGGARCAGALVKHLALREDEPMLQSRIARALAALRTHDPEVAMDRSALSRACEQNVRGAFDDLASRLALEGAIAPGDPRRTPVFELLVTILRDNESDSIARICLLLGLLHPREKFGHIHRGLRARDPKTRASSRELIENVVTAPLRDGVLALVDERTDAQRLARAGRWGRGLQPEPAAILRALLSRGGDVRSLAACYAAEAQLLDVEETAALRPSVAPSALSAGLAARARQGASASGVRHAS
jgi:ATP:ADP antiporter, AAA family